MTADHDELGDETATLGGRMRRYARVGGAMGGLAARFAGGRVFGVGVDQKGLARDLKLALGGLKGPLMKVAQIMSTVPDMLPDDYVKQLAELQTNAPSMGWPFVRRRMAAELGPDWTKRFAAFEREAAAAASLGQVHRATALDGTPLACKLQYPDMGSAVEADLKQLRLVFAVYRRYDRAIDPTEIHAELSDRLREELDYTREAWHQKLYRAMLKGVGGVHVAPVRDELSTARLLTSEWLDGARLLDFVEHHAEARNAIAVNMFNAWYVPFYRYGVLHGDPHLGNYTVRPDDYGVNLFDFGCIRVFRPDFVGGVLDLYHALRDGDEDRAVHAYRTWGFEGLAREVIDILNLWAEFVYAPIMEDRSRTIQEGRATTYGSEVAAKVHRELRRVGGVRPPREFVLMDRAAIGLGSVFLHLRAELNWCEMFRDLVRDFDLDALARRQGAALDAAGVPRPR